MIENVVEAVTRMAEPGAFPGSGQADLPLIRAARRV